MYIYIYMCVCVCVCVCVHVCVWLIYLSSNRSQYWYICSLVIVELVNGT